MNKLQFFLIDSEGKESFWGTLKELRTWAEDNKEMLSVSWENQDDKPELAIDSGGSEDTDGVEMARLTGDACRQFLVQLLEV